MGKAKQTKIEMDMMYDTADVSAGFDYWYYKLLNLCLGMYTYSGLPDSLPAREIEMNLIATGHAAIFPDERGELVTTITQLFGFDLYYRPTEAVYGNPDLIYKRLIIGSDCEMIYNNRIRGNVLRNQLVDSGLATFIKRYARLLADVESTIDIRLVNSRMTSYPVADTQQMAEQLRNIFRQLEKGKRFIITDSNFAQAFRTVETASHTDVEKVGDLLIARDKILSMFYRDIGVKFEQQQKKAQLTEDEVTADEQLLLINISDMLAERREGLERVNAKYGTNITVEISELFRRPEPVREEENQNDSAENNTSV